MEKATTAFIEMHRDILVEAVLSGDAALARSTALEVQRAVRRQKAEEAKKQRTYTGRLNDLGDELLITPGFSDWGEKGWFVAVEQRVPGREPFVIAKTFYPGEDSREEALRDAQAGYYYGFPNP